MKRVFDVLCATIGLMVLAPVLLVAAIGIRLSSPGPIFYRALRVGLNGRLFTMFKLRTMRPANGDRRAVITAPADGRIFPFGRFLRRVKLDELPQLLNVLWGDMSIIGPRPEDPEIVLRYYTSVHRETLTVPPGLASPGSLYHDTCCDRLLAGDNTERAYVERLLPIKIALDLVYVRNASLAYDVALVARTLGVVVAQLLGTEPQAEVPELPAARQFHIPVVYQTPSASVGCPASPASAERAWGAELVSVADRVRGGPSVDLRPDIGLRPQL